MLLRSRTALEELNQMLQIEREAILAEGYGKKTTRKMLIRYDEYCSWLNKYLARKIIFFNYHFSALWSENWLYFYNSALYAKIHNTAARHIYNVLMGFKKKYERV